jgi:hypothetical protein
MKIALSLLTLVVNPKARFLPTRDEPDHPSAFALIRRCASFQGITSPSPNRRPCGDRTRLTATHLPIPFNRAPRRVSSFFVFVHPAWSTETRDRAVRQLSIGSQNVRGSQLVRPRLPFGDFPLAWLHGTSRARHSGVPGSRVAASPVRLPAAQIPTALKYWFATPS